MGKQVYGLADVLHSMLFRMPKLDYEQRLEIREQELEGLLRILEKHGHVKQIGKTAYRLTTQDGSIRVDVVPKYVYR